MGCMPSKPKYGRRLIVDVVDEAAASEPDRPFIYAPRSNEPEDGWQPITYQQLANAVNHVAYIVSTTIKPDSNEEFPTLAYVGPNDVRYVVLMLASIKAGCKALYISPRNSLEGQRSLFERTQCKHFWYPESFQTMVEPWIQGFDMKCSFVASKEEWLNARPPKPFPYKRTFKEGQWDPAVVLHTSGSTGIPKPIVVRQGSLAVGDGYRVLPEYQGGKYMVDEYVTRTNIMFSPMPMFHAAGLIGFMSQLAVFYGKPLALGPPDKPLTPELATKCIEHSGIDSAILPPFLVEEMVKDEESMKVLQTLKFLTFGGGNLSRTAGEKLVKNGIIPNNNIASTELVPYAIHFQPNTDVWDYFIINSEAMGAVWRCVDEKEGVYELCIRRKGPGDPTTQPCFYTFPDLEEWSTGDLFKAHRTLQDHWMYFGRADNIIVFSTGEKLNPVTIEDTLAGHPALKGALVCGQDRFQPALILEPAKNPKNEAEKEALIEEVWPRVKELNKITVAHGHIVRRLVMVSDPNMPFQRTPKGTVQRGMALKSYKDHIDELYRRAENADAEEPASLDFSNEGTLTQSIIDMFNSRVGVENVQPDADFFSLGVDSLQVISVSNILRSSFNKAGVSIEGDVLAPRAIYSNPTPQRLAGYLYVLAMGGAFQREDEAAREHQTFNDLVAKYTKDLPAPRTDKPEPQDEGQTVLLTGTTGSLGAYLLDILCNKPGVSKVVALNRGEDGGKSRQASISSSRGLGTDYSKVEFLGADLSLPDFGLGAAKYEELRSTADRFIHNAWPVNFNINIASFEPYIRGVRHLVDFSSQATKQVPVVFLSSIGTVNGWNSTDAVPEQALNDFALADMGYGRSKLAGSLILDAAASYSGIPAASIRVGQIAGPNGEKGMWNKQEYLPSLVASSLHLGVLPETIGPGDEVDWVPVGDVAGLILDVAGVTENGQVSEINGYFHCANPHRTSWEKLANTIKEFYGGRIDRLVSLEEWITALERSAGEADTSKNPGVKLLDTYKGMLQGAQTRRPHVTLAMGKTMARSPTVARLGPVTPELLTNWLTQWDF